MDQGNIEQVYELSYLQEGLLFESLYTESKSNYFIQSVYQIKGNLDVQKFRLSFDYLMMKYDVLRTAITILPSSGRAWQVVLKNREIEVDF
ncbi:MAG TPA: hypothetical protein GXZ76_07970, partial [Clostridiaceae bacterium]|nr:hypothetical protein [Clostridiaceae bacterium]